MSEKYYSLGLIGYPLGHSFSAAIHRAALDETRLQGDYRLFPVPPLPAGEPRIQELLQDMRAGRLSGFNVTIPYKQAILPYLDEITPLAVQIGAVNTILIENGRLTGDNTDAPGFTADLEACFPGIKPDGQILILGAGGSAYAVAQAALQKGWRILVAARRMEQAGSLKEHFHRRLNSGAAIETTTLDTHGLSNLLYRQKISLIVNCTPVGMSPYVHRSPWPDGIPFPGGAVIYDLVYNPAETAIVRQARGSGLAAVTGAGMLVEQAALAFERWTGVEAPRLAMRAALQAETMKSAPLEKDPS